MMTKTESMATDPRTSAVIANSSEASSWREIAPNTNAHTSSLRDVYER